ncbi:MAG: triose-phosphate isomerase [Candidatus Omnitrophica bacterium]|nr:triose-phosphate isomerase [Candidatus Omnitrophota bacterium]MBU2436353.1 triose-phosphate isomerase [Candidatus Omnitrophota bacterium]
MRKPIIAGNWKMNKTIKEALELINSLKRELVYIEGVDIIVCPPYTALSDASEILMDSNIKLGAQDVYWEHSGAFTGEVSALMLKDVGCEYVILGHSERRKYFFETDEAVNKKIKTSLSVGLTPICCVGETLDEREEEKTFDIIKRQLQGALKDLSQEDISRLVIAYEPVWAIGTGKTATPAQAEEVHKFIRTWLERHYSYQTSQDLRILYGGSVKPSNTKELMREDDIDGALVGGASLESVTFIEIVKNAI